MRKRPLVARLAEGAVGRALTIDLDAYLTSRQDALLILRTALREPDYSQLFHATESYRGGADGQEKTISLLRAMGSLLEDLLLMLAATPGLIRNLDLSVELERMAQGLTVDWIAATSRAVVQVEQGMRLQPVAIAFPLDAMAVGLQER